MAKDKRFIHHEYPTEGRSREDEELANRKLGNKRIPTPIVAGTGKKQGGSTSHRGQDEAESIVYELTGGEGVVPPDMADDAQAAAQMFTISQRNARKWKSLKKQVELLKEGFTYEKDHDPEKHVKVETKERDQTGFVDGTGSEVETAMSKEEPLEELTDDELTEIEKLKKGCGCNESLPIEKADDGKPLNKPMRDDGDKKFKVYVRDPKTGNVVTVRFGDPNMEIKRDDPERRASFRARHDCANAKDITTPKYWSCKMWEKNTSVTQHTNKACWEGYEQIGMKEKDGKMVPNCVPIKKAAIEKSLQKLKTSAEKIKKLKQETFPTEKEIIEEKHEAAKKKKKEVWNKARKEGIGTRWINSSNVTKWTPQDAKSIKDRGASIEASATNVEGDTLEQAQEKRRAARKRKPAGGNRKKLQQQLENLNLSMKSLQEINKLASSDPERVQQTGRAVRARRRSGEIPSWKRQYPTGGIESDKKTKPASGAPIGVNPSEQTPEKPTGKTTVVREGTEKPKGKFAKVREALGGLKDRITNRKQEIETGKPPVEQAETKRGRPARTPKTGRRPAGTTPRSRGGKGKKQPTTTTTSATPQTDKLRQQTGSLKETIESYKKQVGSDDDPTMFKKRQKIRGSQS